MLTPQEMKEHLALRIAPPEKFTVIHSGVEQTRFDPTRFSAVDDHAAMDAGHYNHASAPVNGIEEKIVIGTVGRLTAIKGQDVLLRAFAELAHMRDDVFLVLLGEGEMRGELEETARRLGVYKVVKFLGWRPDVAAVMASFDIFCLPSLNEGMGKVVVEAMAMGLPVVASNVGGIKDLVRDGQSGLLVPPGDASALSGALAALCREPEKRRLMGAVGRKSAPSYSVEAMVGKIEFLYESFGTTAAFR
jgi:glycosyltransferase involved in cell wall biosynthesis